MERYLFRLNFKGPIHFGRHGIGLEETGVTLGSDSFCSAVVNALALMDEAGRAVDDLQRDKPAFVFSSLFPYGIDDGQKVLYLLPRPAIKPNVDYSVLAKEIKKRKWLTCEQVVAWLAMEKMEEEKAVELAGPDPVFIETGPDGERQQWWIEEMRPRVTLDRSSSNSSIWWCSTVVFRPGCGLYGILELNDSSWKTPLTEALNLLGEIGLGGERTYGMGGFETSGFIPLEDINDFKILEQIRCRLLLSRCFPAENELPNLKREILAWEIAESRGYVVSGRNATSIKRKRLSLMLEGAVARRSILIGSLADVTPENAGALGLDHRVYRCGLGLWIGKGGAA